MSWLLSTLATLVGWLPGWLVLALVASVIVAGWLSGGLTRAATVLLTVAVFAALGGWEARDWRQSQQDRAAAERLLAAERAARSDELIRFKNAERTAHEQAKREKATLARAAAAERAVGQLRDEIAALNARPVPEDPRAAALAVEASTARDLLGRCADAYRRVDGRAQALGDQVTGLHDWVRGVCRSGGGEPPE